MNSVICIALVCCRTSYEIMTFLYAVSVLGEPRMLTNSKFLKMCAGIYEHSYTASMEI